MAIVTGGLCVWALWFGGDCRIDHVFDGVRLPIYTTTAAVAASLLGFSLTVIAVVVGFASHKRLALLRENKNYPTVWRNFFSGVRFLGLLLICAFLGLVFDGEERSVLGLEVVYVALVMLCTLRLSRSVWILRQLVDLLAKPTQ